MIVGCNLPDVKLLKSFIGIGTEKGSQVFNKTPAYKQITQAASQPPVMTIKEVMFGNFREVPGFRSARLKGELLKTKGREKNPVLLTIS
jgi:hypothetical protein